MPAPVLIEGYPDKAWTKSLPRRCLLDRDEVIIETCRGRTVLHVGAADAPFDLEKGRRGELLHQKVRDVAARIVGVDVDAGAVEHLRELGITDILVGDIISDASLLQDKTFDVVLCCDVIEHVTDLGGMLGSCRRYMRGDTQLIVTTANATALKPALRALMGRESVHHDHTSYFSYATMCQLLIKCGLKPVAFGVFSYPTVQPIVGMAMRQLMLACPGAADGIMVTAIREDAV